MKAIKILALSLVLTLVLAATPLVSHEAYATASLVPQEAYAKAAEKKSTASIVVKKKKVKVGKRITLTVSNAHQKVKWSVSNKKAIKIVKVSGKKSQKAVFLAKKAQKVTVTAKIGKKRVRYDVDITSGKVLLNVFDDVVTYRVAYEVVNGTDKKINYGADLTLERYENTSWVLVPIRGDAVIPPAEYSLKANSRYSGFAYIDWLYGDLPSGKYRISKAGIGKSNPFMIEDARSITVSVKFDTPNSKKMTLTVFNGTDKDISINPYEFLLQKRIDGAWTDVGFNKTDFGYTGLGHTIRAGKKWSKELVLDDAYDDITPGDYAIEVMGTKRAFFSID